MTGSKKWASEIARRNNVLPARDKWVSCVLEEIVDKDPAQEKILTVLLRLLVLDIGQGKINRGSRDFFVFASSLPDEYCNVVSDLAKSGVLTENQELSFEFNRVHGYPGSA